jgi:hypothetical protein
MYDAARAARTPHLREEFADLRDFAEGQNGAQKIPPESRASRPTLARRLESAQMVINLKPSRPWKRFATRAQQAESLAAKNRFHRSCFLQVPGEELKQVAHLQESLGYERFEAERMGDRANGQGAVG